MRVEARKRVHGDGIWHFDVVLVSESEEESEILDLLGDTPDSQGICSLPDAEVRLSDDLSCHYVLLKGDA